MGEIAEHLVHGENNKIDKMKDSMNSNIAAYDSVVGELFNYNKYKQLHLNHANGSDGNFDDNYLSDAGIGDKLLDLMNKNTEYQKQLLLTLDKESQSASKSYNKSADMYRNQKFVENVVEEEVDTLKKNNKDIFNGVDNAKRNIEINNYYYKKNKVQIQILYYLIGLCILIYILGFLNKSLNYIFNDNLYVLCVGILLGIFGIYLCYAFYDIYLRDEHNFDEYKTFWKTKVVDSNDKVDIPNEYENDYNFELCDADYSELSKKKV